MNQLQVPAAGRMCGCGELMKRARSGSLRWRCPSCKRLSDPDPYLESVRDGAPQLPGMPIEPEPERRWVLHFEGVPPGPNGGGKLKDRIAAKLYWRDVVGGRVAIQRIPKLGRVRLSAVFYRRALGLADEDNDRARLKVACDSLVRAGVIPRDTRRYVEWGEVREEQGPTGFALVIEAIDG